MSQAIDRDFADEIDVSGLAPHRVHHFFTDFDHLEKRYPGKYPRHIVRGEGAFLYDADGKRLLDACQHLGACPIGHGRSEMADAVAEQIRTLEYSSLDQGYTHSQAIRFADRLASLLPLDDPKIYFGSTGSEAVETAIKLARNYHDRMGEPGRYKILSRDGGYHGVGYGALSANGNPSLREKFGPLVPGFVLVPQPWPGRYDLHPNGAGGAEIADEMARIIERESPDTVAAFIAEPISMHYSVKIPEQSYWDRVQEVCREYGVLLIADEVVNGFGRTGRLFGCERYGIEPDIVTMAKGLTSAYVPLGAVAASRRIADAFIGRPFLHNSTYSGHPVATTAANTALDIVLREKLPEHAAAMEPVIEECLAEIVNDVPCVTRANVAGMLSCIEFDDVENQGDDLVMDVVTQGYEEGVLVRGLASGGRGSLYFYPPLVATEEDIREGIAALHRAVKTVFPGVG